MSEEEKEEQQDDSDIFPRQMSREEMAELHRKGDITYKEYTKKYGQGGSGIGPGRP